MKNLSIGEYNAFVSAIKGEEYNKSFLKSAFSTLRFCSGRSPAPDNWTLPDTLRAWRANPEFALAYIDAHVESCNAADLAFWNHMTSKISMSKTLN
jgi:hypothetical protein